MKTIPNITFFFILFVTLFSQLGLTDQPTGQPGEPLEQRAYVLAGYIPKFYEIPDVSDPFNESTWKQYKKDLQEYKEGIVSFLKQQGIDPKKSEFIPDHNALILTDTRDNLETYEILIRNLFRPDMQLNAIQATKQALRDDRLFEGDCLMRVGFLADTTFRAFHGEVRKLEEALKALPSEHKERIEVQKRLETARKYRTEGVNLYLEYLQRQEQVLRAWQSEYIKTEQTAEQTATTPEPKEGDEKPKPQTERRSK